MELSKSDGAAGLHNKVVGRAVDRRTVVKGAAWSVPAIVAAAAAPMSSASGCGDQAGSFGTTEAGFHQQWIPKCATTVKYIVRGGGGAVAIADNGDSLGRAAEITGTLLLPATWAGGWLKFYVGAGGQAVQYGVAQGGIGFGRGGNGTSTADASGSGETSWSLAGGGGSALLFGDSLLVVAGGGGGSGVAINPASTDGTLFSEVSGESSDHAPSGFTFGTGSQNKPNGKGIGAKRPGATASGFLMGPARGGENGGASRSTAWSNNAFTITGSFGGGDGTFVGSGWNGGGNGGAAAAAVSRYRLPGETVTLLASPVGGGGGGGYMGGGGGGFAFARRNYGTETTMATAVVSGGGAGSSFVAGKVSGIDVTGSVGVFTEASEVRQGHLGRVWLAWS